MSEVKQKVNINEIKAIYKANNEINKIFSTVPKNHKLSVEVDGETILLSSDDLKSMNNYFINKISKILKLNVKK